MADKFCPQCGRANRPAARFCVECGRALRVQAAPKFCAQCGARRRPEARFCAQCGQPWAAAAPAEPPVQQTPPPALVLPPPADLANEESIEAEMPVAETDESAETLVRQGGKTGIILSEDELERLRRSPNRPFIYTPSKRP